jgi:disulfide bond formation protein DsbB
MSSAAPEVVQPGLEVVSNKPPTYKDYTPMPQSPYQKAAYAATVLESPADHKTERSERTVMGMRVATFCLLVALILVIVVAGVGGGVGGTLAVNNAKKNAEA